MLKKPFLLATLMSLMFVTGVLGQTGTLFVEGDNVGIGTATPQARLDVENTAGNADLRFFSAASANIILDRGNTSSFSRFQFQTGSTLHWSVGMINDASNDLHFGPNIFTTHLFLDKESGNVGIGTTAPQGRLDVNGAIFQRGGLLHADYVFDPEYQLESLEEHARFMWENQRLPAMPKAMVDEHGYEVVEIGAHRRGILEELEKAHIYIHQLHEELQSKNNTIASLNDRLSRLEGMVEALSTPRQPLDQ